MARAGKSLPDWHLDIVGDGPDAAALKELAERLRLSNVSFEGFRNPAPYYRRASIFCMTSTFEGFGLVLPEAHAARLRSHGLQQLRRRARPRHPR